jgi:HEAT repeat protein
MADPESLASRDAASQTPELTQEQIHSLERDMRSPDGLTREEARKCFISMGSVSVPPLLRLVADPSHRVRWEATKALVQISDPAAAPAFVRALEDDTFGVRWLAAEGLIRLGAPSITPLLEALIQRSHSVWLREGAHHVLLSLVEHGLRDHLEPVIEALEGLEPALTVPEAAERALKRL